MKSNDKIGRGRMDKGESPVIQGGRRITRLQSKLSSRPLHSSAPLLPCSKLIKKDTSLLDQAKHHFHSAERFKEALKVTKPIPYANEHEQSEVNSSSNLDSPFQAMVDNFSGPLSTSKAPAENENLEGHSRRNDCIEPVIANFPSEDGSNFPETPAVTFEQSNQSVHFGLTEIVNICGNEDLNADEAESSPVVLILGKYPVKEALEPTIRRIIEKHGDIAANCHMERPKGRSSFLEQLAELVEKIETKTFANFSEGEIKEAIRIVSDMSKVGLDVGWLQLRLEKLLEARKKIKQYSTLKEMQQRKNEVVQEKMKQYSTLQEMEQRKGEVVLEKRMALQIAESGLVLLQQQVNAAKKELDAERAECESLKKTISDVVSDVKNFNAQPPLHGLL